MINQEKIYIGKNYRILVEQSIGPNFMESIKEKYSVKELKNSDEIIFLIEENNFNI